VWLKVVHQLLLRSYDEYLQVVIHEMSNPSARDGNEYYLIFDIYRGVEVDAWTNSSFIGGASPETGSDRKLPQAAPKESTAPRCFITGRG